MTESQLSASGRGQKDEDDACRNKWMLLYYALAKVCAVQDFSKIATYSPAAQFLLQAILPETLDFQSAATSGSSGGTVSLIAMLGDVGCRIVIDRHRRLLGSGKCRVYGDTQVTPPLHTASALRSRMHDSV